MGPTSNGDISAFAAELARDAKERGVAIASVQAILAKIRDAGVPEEEIPTRLRGAVDGLAQLRSRLANEESGSLGCAPIRSEALARLDCGDLDAAVETLAQACEDGRASGEKPACCQSAEAQAEIYADAASIDHLRLDYRAAAEKYGAAAALVAASRGPGSNARMEWRFRMDRAQELYGDGCEFGNRQAFLEAIETCHSAFGLVARENAPLDWAATNFHLGNAVLALGVSDDDRDRVEEAVDAYLAALEEWSRERAPFDWAKAQNNLGDALLILGAGDDGLDRLRPAIEAYQAALQEWTRDHVPALWAMTHTNLANALAATGLRGGGAEPPREAVGAYRAALEGLNDEIAPQDLATTQNSLGETLLAIRVREACEREA
ncbi:hypothetical protein RZS28_00435 [Methylocapsa polymorpha]|uniref:Tetratricopeptide repeat protein n=1 Tax=Methylocapsa polymorpha TaxID=3080828 RepID=A0ABZ0HSF1_9HYPH|nr:hypothetical protein RZS28_00435 [Methylocapsa sp. RX1]